MGEETTMSFAYVAAVIFAVVIVGVVGFQIALALGAPWGAYAMAGKFPGRFPPAMRVGAVVQAALLGLLAVVVLSRAGIIVPSWSSVSWPIWVVVAFTAVSTLLNAISPSAGERRIWVPATVVLLATSLVVALTAA
jgi:hypothetical protein